MLGAVFVVYSILRMTPRLVAPESNFSCRASTDEYGLPTSTDCALDRRGTYRTVYDCTPLDMARDSAVPFVQETVVGLLGGLAGVLVARQVLRVRRGRGRGQPG